MSRSRKRAPGTGRRSPAEGVADLVPRVLDDLGLDAASTAVAVLSAWDDAVGTEAAPHCCVEGVRKREVHARVRDSAWMQRIQLQKPRILARLRERLGNDAPDDLRLRIGSIPD